jgi:hypothetical protein
MSLLNRIQEKTNQTIETKKTGSTPIVINPPLSSKMDMKGTILEQKTKEDNKNKDKILKFSSLFVCFKHIRKSI